MAANLREKAEKPNKALTMPTIFIQGKPVIICNQVDEGIRLQITAEQLTLLKNPDTQNLTALLSALQDDAMHGYVLETDDPDALQQFLVQHYEHWHAAGGLITNPAGDVLLMFRRGKWDLPKGKTDAGETPEQTALREVTEETGLHHIHIVQKLTDTWHAYHQFGKDILKQTHWYKMTFTGSELTVPQIEEDIMDIQWIRPENIPKYLPFSYPNLKAVFHAAGLIS